MSTDWYQKKLGHLAPAPEKRDPTPGGGRFTPMPNSWPQPAAITPPTQVEYPAEPATGQPLTPQQVAELERNGKMSPLDALLYAGSQAKKLPGKDDSRHCPECGGTNLFSRRNTSGLRSGNAFPAPQCSDCGWPLVQSGSIGGALEAGE